MHNALARSAAIALLVLAACTPPGTGGQPCNSDDDCESEQACLDGACALAPEVWTTDGGVRRDAGQTPRVDAGGDVDAGSTTDAGTDVDAGIHADAGTNVDAGSSQDSGPPPVDGGPPPVDSGPPPVDSGPVIVDAGPDCGNGTLQAGEDCDLGALNSNLPDATCRTDCTDARCGDGVEDTGEQCDLGGANSNAPNGVCRTNCTDQRCGDGVEDNGEQCDLGGANSNAPDGVCRTDCKDERCGDGIVDTGEDCDLGGTNSNAPDGVCRTNCRDERCGDGIVDSGERCDLGNANSNAFGSSCTTMCQLPPPASCAEILARGGVGGIGTGSGVFSIVPTASGVAYDVYCDMTTDGGGWTLVGSTFGTTLNDQAGDWHADLKTLAPAVDHVGLWNALRSTIPGDSDIRFACKTDIAGPMIVDLSFYENDWYRRATTGTDAESCLREGSPEVPPASAAPAPARRNNLTGDTRPFGDVYDAPAHVDLCIEDSCDDPNDFTVDFDDSGMDNNQSDGTDWGEDDGKPKCGQNDAGIAWFVFVR